MGVLRNFFAQNRKIEYHSSAFLAFRPGRRIGNRVRIPDGSVAVCAEAALVDESRSLGNWEGRACAAGEFLHKRKSEDLLEHAHSGPR